MRQPVGLTVELIIAEVLVFIHQGNGIWRLFHLLFEQLMDAQVLREVRLGSIEVIDDLLPFVGGQNAEEVDW